VHLFGEPCVVQNCRERYTSAMNSKRPAEYKDRLRAAGLKWTGPRAAVLAVLEQATAPVSHAEVADLLAAEGFDRATVYRNLVDLTEAGLVARADLGDHVWRFELRSADDEGALHPHFTCTTCGTVACLPAGAVALSALKKAQTVGHVAEILLKGQCVACA
jgi:Fur family transcriptional regulator, ferric uptake regulator